MFNLQQMHFTLICLAWLLLWGEPFHRAGLLEQRKWGLLKDSSVCDSIQKEDLRGAGNLGWVGRAAEQGVQGREEKERSPPTPPVAPVGHPHFNFPLMNAVCLTFPTGIINRGLHFLLKSWTVTLITIEELGPTAIPNCGIAVIFAEGKIAPYGGGLTP